MQTLTRADAGEPSAPVNTSRHWLKVTDYRAISRFLDGALVVAVALAVVATTTILQFLGTLMDWEWLHDGAQSWRPFLTLAGAGAFHAYNNIWLVSRRGSSASMRWLGLRIERRSGGLLNPVQATIREALTSGWLWIAVLVDRPHFRIGWFVDDVDATWSDVGSLGGIGSLIGQVGDLPLALQLAVVLSVIHLAMARLDPRRRTLPDRIVGSEAFSADASTPSGIHRDVRVYQGVAQVIVIIALWTLGQWLIGNLFTNLDRQGISRDFGFLDQRTGIAVSGDRGFDSRSPVRSMMVVAIKNTFLAASLGIVLATMLGTLIGIARLSSNWLVARLGTAYVEMFRNIPPLLVIIFFGQAVFTFGPLPQMSPTSAPWQYSFPGTDTQFLVLSNSVWGVPSIGTTDIRGTFWWLLLIAVAWASATWVSVSKRRERPYMPVRRLLYSAIALTVGALVASAATRDNNVHELFAGNGVDMTRPPVFWWPVVIGMLGAVAMWRWRTRVNLRTGAPHHRVVLSLGVLLGVLVIGFVLTGQPYHISWPSVAESGRRIEGGFVANAGYMSVTFGLTLYTASNIAELVRGSILSVSKGQTEASNALAMSGFQRYRFVVLPQAARVAVPPMINEYLNLTKNTSLGIAVAYAELTTLTRQSIANGRPAVQSLMLLMLVYLVFSIVISILMNRVNKRVQIVGR